MNIIIGGRGSGKTTELIKFASENDYHIVCENPRLVANHAKNLGYVIDYPLRYSELVSAKHTAGKRKGFVIDEIDLFFKNVCGPSPVECIVIGDSYKGKTKITDKSTDIKEQCSNDDFKPAVNCEQKKTGEETMSKKIMTPAAINAGLEGNLNNFITAIKSGGIEEQEKKGQDSFINNEILPIEIKDCTKSHMESLGFVFGDKVDDIFCKATLPEGWKKTPTYHSMWSKIIDSWGRTRVEVFYKATFYDRHAFMRMKSCYNIVEFDESDLKKYKFVVTKDMEDNVVFETPFFDELDDAYSHAKNWLDSHSPDWKNCAKYWE